MSVKTRRRRIFYEIEGPPGWWWLWVGRGRWRLQNTDLHVSTRWSTTRRAYTARKAFRILAALPAGSTVERYVPAGGTWRYDRWVKKGD